MFPVKLCGTWCLVYTNNKLFNVNSQLQIDYNKVKFSPKENFWGLDITKNMYGVVRADIDIDIDSKTISKSSIPESKAKIVWLKSIDYQIDTHILPYINIPYNTGMYCQTHLTYELDDTLTIKDGIYDYVFIRDLKVERTESFIRVFMTQLILDHIIRHI